MLDRSASGDKVPDQNDNADDQQDMDETAGNVECEEAQRPENQDDDGNCKKHCAPLLWLMRNGSVTVQERGGSVAYFRHCERQEARAAIQLDRFGASAPREDGEC